MKPDQIPLEDYQETPFERFVALRKADFIAFVRYPGLIDFRSALYSIFFIVTASWWFKRIPDLPFTVLIAIPFVYLSALGVGLLMGGAALEQVFETSRFDFMRKLFAKNGTISGFCRRDGEKFLHAAFAVGVLFFAASFFLAARSESPWVWFLPPLILFCMVAQFSLNQHLTKEPGEKSRLELRKSLLRRCFYALAVSLALWGVYSLLAAIVRQLLA